MRAIIVFLGSIFLHFHSYSQNIGIGTQTPHPRAALEIKSTDKGVLFPRMTSAQRNAIPSPPDGLHIFNTDERCINIFDSVNNIWNCYCSTCQVVIVNITTSTCELDFYHSYAKYLPPASKYVVNIPASVVISGCQPGDTALAFDSIPYAAEITINNYGTIAGAGGQGGNGMVNQGCYFGSIPAQPGYNGGAAISARTGITIKVNNYGIIAGGGGGGGGSGGNAANTTGGGGGGGAGIIGGIGGLGGGSYISSPIVGCVGAISRTGAQGVTGTATTGGSGGAGNGGFVGGTGGNRGTPGQAGNAFGTPIPGGLAGKAIQGGSGNSIVNNGGQVFGTID